MLLGKVLNFNHLDSTTPFGERIVAWMLHAALDYHQRCDHLLL